MRKGGMDDMERERKGKRGVRREGWYGVSDLGDCLTSA